jgi:hypothetical protein
MTQTPGADIRRDGQPIAESTTSIKPTRQTGLRVEQLGLFNGPTVFTVKHLPTQGSFRLPIRW